MCIVLKETIFPTLFHTEHKPEFSENLRNFQKKLFQKNKLL